MEIHSDSLIKGLRRVSQGKFLGVSLKAVEVWLVAEVASDNL
jgi:hypothetical protein